MDVSTLHCSIVLINPSILCWGSSSSFPLSSPLNTNPSRSLGTPSNTWQNSLKLKVESYFRRKASYNLGIDSCLLIFCKMMEQIFKMCSSSSFLRVMFIPWSVIQFSKTKLARTKLIGLCSKSENISFLPVFSLGSCSNK